MHQFLPAGSRKFYHLHILLDRTIRIGKRKREQHSAGRNWLTVYLLPVGRALLLFNSVHPSRRTQPPGVDCSRILLFLFLPSEPKHRPEKVNVEPISPHGVLNVSSSSFTFEKTIQLPADRRTSGWTDKRTGFTSP